MKQSPSNPDVMVLWAILITFLVLLGLDVAGLLPGPSH